jgi:hydroxyacylglutathione hydrolase
MRYNNVYSQNYVKATEPLLPPGVSRFPRHPPWRVKGPMTVKIEQFVIEGLGHQSYLITDEASGNAAVVDPRRDVDVYLQAANSAGVRITHVLETHIHNDYITGSRELAARTGAAIVASALDPLHYPFTPVREGDRFSVGQLSFQALATPGHTPAHTSYLLFAPQAEQPDALFSGGSLLVASVGRTDLLGEDMTLTLTHQQYQSLQHLLTTLPGQVHVYPTHGAGSFCLSNGKSSAERSTTIAQELLVNPAALAKSEEDFVERQLAGYSAYPTYYNYMAPINRAGPRILGTLPTPPALSPHEVNMRLQQGIPLIDARPRGAFAHAHIPGSLNMALENSFATYVGWLLPFNTPLMLLIEDEAGRHEAVVQLIRIGYERIEGYLDGGLALWKADALPTSKLETIDIETLYKRLLRNESFLVLDVRRIEEWDNGHIPGSMHIHIAELAQRMHELPRDLPIMVICHTGYRAGIAASMIAGSGREAVAVRGGMGDWLKGGLPFASCESNSRNKTRPLEDNWGVSG